MLAHEQKVHEYLQRLQHREDGSALTIPNFLPPKMKELLAELAMVENEITRLESQINQLKDEVKHGKEVNMESKYKEWGRATNKNHHDSLSLPPNPYITFRRPNEKVTFGTKALHFISKAIKGEYNMSDFSITDKKTNSKKFATQKENTFQEERGVSQENVSKRSGILKPPSPLREPRHRTTPRRDRNLDIPTEIPPKMLSTPLHSEEETIHRWPPNKLSENIMKCLIFIYVRLLRTSRVMELEKSGPIASPTNFSLSFRAEPSSNSKINIMFQKDSQQQDPYGIFDSEESITRDIGPSKNLVRFTSSSMDLICIQNSRSIPLFQKLKVLMDSLQKVDLRFLSHQQKLAFWINMYNACIMHGFLQYGVPSVSSPDNLLSLINKATLNIAGNTINAQAIENLILRKPHDSLVKESDKKEMIVRELYGLETPDPNVTFALCCGTRSSPAVKIYTADGVNSELERSKLDYLQKKDHIFLNFSKSMDLSNRQTPGIIMQYKYFTGRVGKQRLREARIQAVDYLILLLAGICLGTLAKVSDETFGSLGYLYTVIAVSLLCKIAALRAFSQDKLHYWRESASGMSSLAYFLSKDTVDHFNTIVKPAVYLSMFYFFNNPRSTILDNYIVLICLVYCVTGIAYILAIYFEPGPAQLWSVLLPVVLTLIANQEGDTVLRKIGDFCYTKWALEAFLIANAKRYTGVWLIQRCGALRQRDYNLKDYWPCLIKLIATGILSRAFAFLCLILFQKK
ncbi:hypothetical protein BUALT_Bualt02G0042100 [Buddleja alternifolia]|uniref:DUF547 domain-containing protein n=1 Tax=Buddleja alternifolia TaxID=168488 RepID=A0AAV6Y5B1_9LAMI|nr:hypothetical protein BUALT_Bualt02G0042100 [Buddleja alternifolia]